jgi:mannan endo-1,4-beta-mannosidase
MVRHFLFAVVITIATLTEISSQNAAFVSVRDQTFQLDKKPYYFVGTNYWYGSLLGLEKDKKRGANRLRKELDFLQRNGVSNLRLMAGAEGSGMINGVERVGPPMQPVQGKFDEAALDGLDLILAEMAKRKMKAVIFLSNNWEWTGGFQQYVDWNGLIPDDMRTRPLTWDELRDMVARFYVCFECKVGYRKQVEFVLDRANKITGSKYTDDPTIMAWEIANEPRPMRPGANDRYLEWIGQVAALIKSRDKNHLVTIGSEGSIGTESPELFEAVHAFRNIDYLTIHIWPKNWGWFEPGKMPEQFPVVISKVTGYIDEHVAVARRLNKPLVIEEFGLPRDDIFPEDARGPRGAAKKSRSNSESRKQKVLLSLAPGSPTRLRDEYFRKMFSYIGNGPVAGANFWAFGGTARPVRGQMFWKAGDDFMGDPPMEEQGLNSVFDIDSSTWKVIRSASRSLNRRR